MIRRIVVAAVFLLVALPVFAGCVYVFQDGMVSEMEGDYFSKGMTTDSLDEHGAGDGGRLAEVKERGSVICASDTNNPGFGFIGEDGIAAGFDIDLCKAVAAAIFGDANAVEVRNILWGERERLLQKGLVDIVSYNTTWTTGRDAGWGNFAHVMFYTGQGFMVREDSGFDSVDDLGGATVCVTTNTTTELNLADYFRQNGMELETVKSESRSDVFQKYAAGDCDAMTADASGLAAEVSKLDNSDEHKILPEIISKEPLAPIVPPDDDQWFDIVKTVMYVLINAEELGVTQSNVAAMQSSSDNLAVRRMLGAEDFGQSDMGLDADFAVDVIKGVGNYGEIYNRYLGPDAEITLERGMNNLWNNGGLIYAPPIR